MAKEITLEELAGSSARQATPTVPNAVTEGSNKGMRAVSTSDLGNRLKAQHPEANKEEVAEDSPLVKNAFEGMTKTLNEKKDFISNVMMPIVEENAREIAMENEMAEQQGEEEAPEQDTPVEVKADEDDFDMLDDEDQVEEKHYESVNVAPAREPEPLKEVVKQETQAPKVVQIPSATIADDTEDDTADLDSMLKDLGIGDEEEDGADLEDDEESAEELRERFKTNMGTIKIAKDPIDISKFRIRREPVSSSTALRSIRSNAHLKRADWVLYCSGRSMSFAECDGPELDALNKTIRGSNGINGVISTLRFVYDHVIDGNKPTFENWTKLIRTEDIESLYFGLYLACYGDTNLVVRVCDKEQNKNACGKTSLIDTPIMNMVKFESDEVKEKFERIRSMDTTSDTTAFESELLQVSDDIVISYSKPTLYSTFIQYAPLEARINEKYSDYLNTMAYINEFFMIDRNTNNLVPIKIKEYPNNLNKTIMSKLKVYIDILKTLSSDQYNIMKGKLNQIDSMEEATQVSYIFPEAVCPECGQTIKESPVQSVLNLLFTRAQLAQVKNL
jgi:hypothetical protein